MLSIAHKKQREVWRHSDLCELLLDEISATSPSNMLPGCSNRGDVKRSSPWLGQKSSPGPMRIPSAEKVQFLQASQQTSQSIGKWCTLAASHPDCLRCCESWSLLLLLASQKKSCFLFVEVADLLSFMRTVSKKKERAVCCCWPKKCSLLLLSALLQLQQLLRPTPSMLATERLLLCSVLTSPCLEELNTTGVVDGAAWLILDARLLWILNFAVRFESRGNQKGGEFTTEPYVISHVGSGIRL